MFVEILGGVCKYLKIIYRLSGCWLDCMESGVIAFYGYNGICALNLYGWLILLTCVYWFRWIKIYMRVMRSNNLDTYEYVRYVILSDGYEMRLLLIF